MKPVTQECPKAWNLMNSISRKGILDWFSEYPLGRRALRSVEDALEGRLRKEVRYENLARELYSHLAMKTRERELTQGEMKLLEEVIILL